MLSYSDDQVRAKAVELGLVGEGEPVPDRLRSRVVASLAAADTAEQQSPRARLAKHVVVEPEGRILIDGEPLPWYVARDSIEVVCHPKGDGTVRLTLLAERVEITAPKNTESENRA